MSSDRCQESTGPSRTSWSRARSEKIREIRTGTGLEQDRNKMRNPGLVQYVKIENLGSIRADGSPVLAIR